MRRPSLFKPLRLLIVFGTRPQFIKVAAFLRGLAKCSPELRERFSLKLLNTGQHYDDAMAGIFARGLQLPAVDFDLAVGSGSHATQTSAIMNGIEKACEEWDPAALVVFGDTNSTLAGAIVGAKLAIPIIHVEAGLRSFDRSMPEEINRVLTDAVSSLLLCPSHEARRNCMRESLPGRIEVVGDLMIDVALDASAESLGENETRLPPDLKSGAFILATLHRVENTDKPERLLAAVSALENLASKVTVVLPLHPRFRQAMKRGGLSFRKTRTMEPVSHHLMIKLLMHSQAVLTDSGGLQKEAHFLRKPCTTLRSSTEWIETLESGWNVLCKPDSSEVEKAIFRESPDPASWRPLYGEGESARLCWERIADHLQNS